MKAKKLSQQMIPVLFAGLVLAIAGVATAEQPRPAAPVIVLGLGIGALPDYEGSKDYRPIPIVHASYRSGWFDAVFDTTTLKVNLLPTQGLDAGPMARYRIGRGSVDNNAVDDLRNFDDGIEVGGFLRSCFQIYFKFRMKNFNTIK